MIPPAQRGEENVVRRIFRDIFSKIAVIAPLAVAACAAPQSAAEKAWNDATNACERQQQTDARQMCFDTAMRQYQAALAKENAKRASCPASSC